MRIQCHLQGRRRQGHCEGHRIAGGTNPLRDGFAACHGDFHRYRGREIFFHAGLRHRAHELQIRRLALHAPIQFEGRHTSAIKLPFACDSYGLRLFGRGSSVLVGFICMVCSFWFIDDLTPQLQLSGWG